MKGKGGQRKGFQKRGVRKHKDAIISGNITGAQRIPTVGTGHKVPKWFKKNYQILENEETEKKFFITSAATYDVILASSPIPISNIAQGDTQGERSGNSVTFRSIEFNYALYHQTDGNFARVILFQWMPDSGNLAPTRAQILQDSSTMPFLSSYNHSQRHQFRILYDKVHALSAQGSNGVQTEKMLITRIPKRRNEFSSDGSTTGTYQLYLLVTADASVSNPADDIVMDYYVKLNYSDS